MGMMMSLVYFGTLALQIAINTLGTNTIVAHTAARKITEFFYAAIWSDEYYNGNILWTK